MRVARINQLNPHAKTITKTDPRIRNPRIDRESTNRIPIIGNPIIRIL